MISSAVVDLSRYQYYGVLEYVVHLTRYTVCLMLRDLQSTMRTQLITNIFEARRNGFTHTMKDKMWICSPCTNLLKGTTQKNPDRQLDNLVTQLGETEPHYIKCIKPNLAKAPQGWSSPLVIEQLRYSGVLEVGYRRLTSAVTRPAEGRPTAFFFRHRVQMSCVTQHHATSVTFPLLIIPIETFGRPFACEQRVALSSSNKKHFCARASTHSSIGCKRFLSIVMFQPFVWIARFLRVVNTPGPRTAIRRDDPTYESTNSRVLKKKKCTWSE